MRERQYVAYYRISKLRSTGPGLRIDAQRSAILKYLEAHPGKLVEEFAEVESGTATHGGSAYMPDAPGHALDRSVGPAFAKFCPRSSLCESDIDFVAVDLPEANRLTIHLLAAIAEYEAKPISDRIKAALAVAKARGVKLGGNHGLTPERIRAAWTAAARARTAYALERSRDLAPLVWQLRKEGKSCRKIANELEKRGIKSFRGVSWYDSTIREILLRTTEEFSPNGAPYTAIDARQYSFAKRVNSYASLIFS